MSNFTITEEHISFAQQASGALERLLSGLSPEKAGRLFEVVTSIAGAAERRYGTTPAADEIVSLAGVKSAVLSDPATLDIDSALFELEAKSARIARTVAEKGWTETLETDPAEATKHMSPAERMNWSRSNNNGR